MSCGVDCRRGLDPVLLWLWCRPVVTAPIGPLAWEPPYAAGAAQETAKRQKKKKFHCLALKQCISNGCFIQEFIFFQLNDYLIY